MSTKAYSKAEKTFMLCLARSVISDHIQKKFFSENTDCPPFLREFASCFVSLHDSEGNLRGCIGNIQAYEPLFQNIRRNAISAAFRDPRFLPIKSLSELEKIVIEISILTPPEIIKSWKDFEVGKHGIIMNIHDASAVFLPQVAPEQGWDSETTLCYLSIKAGLEPQDWRNPKAEFSVFEAIVFSDNDASN